MVKRCKDCPWNDINEEIKKRRAERGEDPNEWFIEEEQEKEPVNKELKKYSFPKYWIQVRAKDLEEANEKLQAILTSNEK